MNNKIVNGTFIIGTLLLVGCGPKAKKEMATKQVFEVKTQQIVQGLSTTKHVAQADSVSLFWWPDHGDHEANLEVRKTVAMAGKKIDQISERAHILKIESGVNFMEFEQHKCETQLKLGGGLQQFACEKTLTLAGTLQQLDCEAKISKFMEDQCEDNIATNEQCQELGPIVKKCLETNTEFQDYKQNVEKCLELKTAWDQIAELRERTFAGCQEKYGKIQVMMQKIAKEKLKERGMAEKTKIVQAVGVENYVLKTYPEKSSLVLKSEGKSEMTLEFGEPAINYSSESGEIYDIRLDYSTNELKFKIKEKNSDNVETGFIIEACLERTPWLGKHRYTGGIKRKRGESVITNGNMRLEFNIKR